MLGRRYGVPVVTLDGLIQVCRGGACVRAYVRVCVCVCVCACVRARVFAVLLTTPMCSAIHWMT
jgi:hypothetical protein